MSFLPSELDELATKNAGHPTVSGASWRCPTWLNRQWRFSGKNQDLIQKVVTVSPCVWRLVINEHITTRAYVKYSSFGLFHYLLNWQWSWWIWRTHRGHPIANVEGSIYQSHFYSFPKYAFGRSVSKNGQPFTPKIRNGFFSQDRPGKNMRADHESNCSCFPQWHFEGIKLRTSHFPPRSLEVWKCHTFKNKDSRPLTIPQQCLNFNFHLRTCGLMNFKTENFGNWNQTNEKPCFNDSSTENGHVLHHSSKATPCGPWFRLTSQTSAHRMSAPVRGCWRPSQHRLRKKEDRMEVQGIVIRDTVDGRNPANQLRLVVYRLSHLQGFIHPRWCRSSSISSR